MPPAGPPSDGPDGEAFAAVFGQAVMPLPVHPVRADARPDEETDGLPLAHDRIEVSATALLTSLFVGQAPVSARQPSALESIEVARLPAAVGRPHFQESSEADSARRVDDVAPEIVAAGPSPFVGCLCLGHSRTDHTVPVLDPRTTAAALEPARADADAVMARAVERPWPPPEPPPATAWHAETHARPLAEDVTTHITANAADAAGAVPDGDEPGSRAVVPAASQAPAAAAVAVLRGRMGPASSPDTGLMPAADLTRPLPPHEASGPRGVLTLAPALRPHAPVALASDADLRPVGRLTASALESTLDAELQPQLIDAIRVQARSGVREARIRLRPDVLGEVSMVIAVAGRVVSATIEAESPVVRHWMERHEGLLRERLSEQGLQLAHFDVKAEERPRDGERQRREPRDAPQPQMMTRAQRERAARRFAAML